MNAATSFYLIDIAQLENLKQNATVTHKRTFWGRKSIDNFKNFLAVHSKPLIMKDHRGDHFWETFMYLKREKKINVASHEYSELIQYITRKRGGLHYIFTFHEKMELIKQLQHENFALDHILTFNKDFLKNEDNETACLMLGAIEVLIENLKEIHDDSHVLLLSIERESVVTIYRQ